MRAPLVCCLGLFAAIVRSGEVPDALGQAPRLADYFRRQPADSLVRRLETIPIEENGGPAVSQTYRSIPTLRMVLIETTLANRGKAPVRAEGVPIGNWAQRWLGQGPAGPVSRQPLRPYRKLTHRDDVWYGSTYWTGPDWTRVGKDWHHPGINTPSVRRFTAPRNGRVTITGRVYKLDTNNGGGDGVRLFIRHGRQTVWAAEIDGSDSKGLNPQVTLDVRAGDAIRFVVHRRDRIFYDTTHWDPVITYTDGRAWRASEAFAGRKQDGGGWSYEMEVDPRAETGLPRIYGFERDFSLRQQTLGPGRPVHLTDGDALPLMLIADEEDQTGIVLVSDLARPWSFRGRLTSDGRLELKLLITGDRNAAILQPGESMRLPPLLVGAYRGPWVRGMTMLGRVLHSDLPDLGLKKLQARFAAEELPELDLWAMVQTEWQREDKLDGTDQAYEAATARHLEQARRLMEDLRAGQGDDYLSLEAEALERLVAEFGKTGDSLRSRKRRYQQVRRLKRRIAIANPLLRFEKLLFTKRVPTSYSHLVMQYFGWRARPGGGIFVLKQPGRSLACRDLLEGKLAAGNVLEPRLSYDAKRIVFAFVKCPKTKYESGGLDNTTDEGFYHIYEVHTDGTGLRQLTRGPYDDVMPTYLPDGGIAFSSTRRRGYARCFGGQFSRRWHVYTLHRMDADGTNLRTLSFHDTNEWFPAVSHAGHLLYARWDYIDRDAVTHQNLWASRPDGTNPVSVWGNATKSPHCTFQIRPIPGSGKIVFTASAHHSIAGGSIAIVDPSVHDNGQEAITRITPEIPFPEAESRNIREYYAAPWPLSEKYFLVAYSPRPLVWEPRANAPGALGIYLLDALCNRELIYRDPEIGSTNPCPLVHRPVPPVLPSGLPPEKPPTGELVLADVYQGLGEIPRGTIKRLRIIQIFPKTTHLADSPPIGLAREENARAVLGTVPVEPDGSAYFRVPAGKPILFQALDDDGMAYQTMRSVTYVQPGERVTCIGCHENRMTAPANRTVAAIRRPPSPIDPGPFGGRPFSFTHLVQPVLDQHCVSCHGGEKLQGDLDLTGKPAGSFTKSYHSLCGDRNFWGAGTNPKNAAEALVPRFGGRNQVQTTPPGGRYGARGSRLIRMLRQGHQGVKLSPRQLGRLALWIDCNAIFYGVYDPEDQQRQLRGELLAMPSLQ